MKGYKLQYTEEKTLKLSISREVTFNGYASIEGKSIPETHHDVSDYIELEVESLLAQRNSSNVEQVQDINQDDKDAPIQQQSYNIATSRKKRVINQQKQFANVVTENLFRYAKFIEFSF